MIKINLGASGGSGGLLIGMISSSYRPGFWFYSLEPLAGGLGPALKFIKYYKII